MPNNDNIQVLRDLAEIIETTKVNVHSFSKSAEFGISTAFSEALVAAFPDYSFAFFERSIKVTTPSKQSMYVSAQSFAVAVYLMDFCEEIGRYRATAYRILNHFKELFIPFTSEQKKLDEAVFTALRDNSNERLETFFAQKAKEFFVSCTNSTEELASSNTKRLMAFLTDYGSWYGGKQISRGNDWSISAISKLLNMPQNDSNLIARVVSKATEDTDFRSAFKEAIDREWSIEKDAANELSTTIAVAENILLYGVPGCGKSHTIKTRYCNDDTRMERAVFHPDYTYSDFIGQILPRVSNNHIEYHFEPGPFTRILKKAIDEPKKTFFLVIEEINRGNAPAIFGDVFQLLDRDEKGCSEYGVSNENIAELIYGDKCVKIKIPGNLYVLATMNTSDQNVFTLDTAFKRRWAMKMIPNNIDTCKYANSQICAWGITWGTFAKTINKKIAELNENNLSNEDNRLGAYFVKESDLRDAKRFGEKVLMYLWNDAFKFDRDKVFDREYRTLDELLDAFVQIGFAVFNKEIIFESVETEEKDFVEVDNPPAEQYLEGKSPELVKAYRALFADITQRIPSAYDASVGSLSYVSWKTNDIKKASFADIVIKRNQIVIWTEIPSAEQLLAIGEQIPVDNHHNHYFRIIFEVEKVEQIILAIEDAYNHLKVQ